MVYNNILEVMGHTPMIRLNHMVDGDSARVLVKFEGLNVGGSIKTRTAYNMLRDAKERGLIREDTIIVEPTSGNQGIGLALVGAVEGYRVRIIMPDSVSEERRKLMRHYGAEVVLVHDAGNIGKAIEECLKTALAMAKEDPRVFVPQQFENPANPQVHRDQTGLEIRAQVDGPIHGFCSGIGTGGTITGIGETLKEKNPDMVIWAVEPEHAAILSGGSIAARDRTMASASSRAVSLFIFFILMQSPFNFFPGNPSDCPGPGAQGGHHVRHFQRYQRGGGAAAGKKAGEGKDRSDGSAGHGGALFFDAPV